MKEEEKVKLYGENSCQRTKHFLDFLKSREVAFTFFDTSSNEAKELHPFYSSESANMPTIVIGHKVLSNPKEKSLLKWLDRVDAANYRDESRKEHDTRQFRFSCGITKAKEDISDSIGY